MIWEFADLISVGLNSLHTFSFAQRRGGRRAHCSCHHLCVAQWCLATAHWQYPWDEGFCDWVHNYARSSCSNQTMTLVGVTQSHTTKQTSPLCQSSQHKHPDLHQHSRYSAHPSSQAVISQLLTAHSSPVAPVLAAKNELHTVSSVCVKRYPQTPDWKQLLAFL